MSDYLFAKPDFIGGIMSLMNLFGIPEEYNSSRSENMADLKALKADINAVGRDFMGIYAEETVSYA